MPVDRAQMLLIPRAKIERLCAPARQRAQDARQFAQRRSVESGKALQKAQLPLQSLCQFRDRRHARRNTAHMQVFAAQYGVQQVAAPIASRLIQRGGKRAAGIRRLHRVLRIGRIGTGRRKQRVQARDHRVLQQGAEYCQAMQPQPQLFHFLQDDPPLYRNFLFRPVSGKRQIPVSFGISPVYRLLCNLCNSKSFFRQNGRKQPFAVVYYFIDFGAAPKGPSENCRTAASA